MSYIKSQGTPLYGKGVDYTVFDLGKWGGPMVGPIICFEDTFGYLSREFVMQGAEVLVNLTNDSWSSDPVSAIQHMTIAIFRSVENRRSMVRSTTAGVTTVIDPNGRILNRLEPFTQGFLLADVPIYTGKTTLYTRWGDWFETVILVVTGLVFIIAIARPLGRKLHDKAGK